MQRGNDAWERGAGWLLAGMAGVGVLAVLGQVAAAAPLLLVPPTVGAYALWRWHRRSLATSARTGGGPPPTP